VLIFRRQINIRAEIRAKLNVRRGPICRVGSPLLTLIGRKILTAVGVFADDRGLHPIV
jgi:hypothetical protein